MMIYWYEEAANFTQPILIFSQGSKKYKIMEDKLIHGAILHYALGKQIPNHPFFNKGGCFFSSCLYAYFRLG